MVDTPESFRTRIPPLTSFRDGHERRRSRGKETYKRSEGQVWKNRKRFYFDTCRGGRVLPTLRLDSREVSGAVSHTGQRRGPVPTVDTQSPLSLHCRNSYRATTKYHVYGTRGRDSYHPTSPLEKGNRVPGSGPVTTGIRGVLLNGWVSTEGPCSPSKTWPGPLIRRDGRFMSTT